MESEDAASVMLLPTEAQARFEKAAVENSRLTNAFEAQNFLLAELSDALPGDALNEKLKKTEAELANVNRQLADAQVILLSNLTQNDREDRVSDTGKILKVILEKLQASMDALCLASGKAGHLSVPLTAILGLEDQVARIVEDLHERRLYPEKPEETEARIKATEAHMTKISEFLKAFLAAQKNAESE